MKFDELDARMRVFETTNDLSVLPGIHMVARIDGRNFTHLSRAQDFEKPFDERFRDYMIATTEHLMTCGFRILYGYTQSDEISLLSHPGEDAFGRKLRKLNSILAGEAGAKFSLLLGDIGAFDCRISQLPRTEDVVDYFRWRSEDAHRNALNGHCYWMLRKSGKSVGQATSMLRGMSVAAKNELLFNHAVNFNDLPRWQRRGVGLFWETYEKQATNRQTGEEVLVQRKRIKHELELPMKEAYSTFVENLLLTGDAE
jgi:tRNA(His) 5'-end guanylyltransferase